MTYNFIFFHYEPFVLLIIIVFINVYILVNKLHTLTASLYNCALLLALFSVGSELFNSDYLQDETYKVKIVPSKSSSVVLSYYNKLTDQTVFTTLDCEKNTLFQGISEDCTKFLHKQSPRELAHIIDTEIAITEDKKLLNQ